MVVVSETSGDNVVQNAIELNLDETKAVVGGAAQRKPPSLEARIIGLIEKELGLDPRPRPQMF
jgi:hypothetical protein